MSCVVPVPSYSGDAFAGELQVDVVATTEWGTSPMTSADQFSYDAPIPRIGSISPSSGPFTGGTHVTVRVRPRRWKQCYSDRFPRRILAASTAPVHQSTAVSPAESAGPVDVTIVTAWGTSGTTTADVFTYRSPVPVITAVSPPAGPSGGGTVVTITGYNLANATSATFGGTSAVFFYCGSDTSCLTESPGGSLGRVDIVLTNSYGNSTISSSDNFTYTDGNAPVLKELDPNYGVVEGGTHVSGVRGILCSWSDESKVWYTRFSGSGRLPDLPYSARSQRHRQITGPRIRQSMWRL